MTEPVALILSIAIEAIVAATLIAVLRWGDPRRAALAATLGTLVTHPIAWHAAIALDASAGYWTAMIVVESAVVLAESIAYVVIARLGLGRAFAMSLAANGASAGLGIALYAFTDAFNAG